VPASVPNSPAVVSETGQRLQITLPPNTVAYNGVGSISSFDITNKAVQVELAQAVSQAGWCENFLQVALDANNYYLIDAGGGSMVLRSMVNGVNDQTIISYFDPVVHHYWRIRHDPGTNTINFDTSADSTTWTTRKTVTPGFALTGLKFVLYAGAYGTGNSNPGAAKFDNFQLVSNSSSMVANVHWLVSDQLGTPRMVFDQSGSLANTKRHDYLPFGEELFVTTGGRNATQGYGVDPLHPAPVDGVRQQFTQKERDIETGLDYFGARYYGSTQGRFTTADPLLSSASIYDPQTWNRYAYTLNNPLKYIDPLGLYEWDASLGGSATDAELKKRKGGQKIIDRRNEFRNGLAKAAEHGMSLSQRESAELKRSVEAYGKEGVSNGVAVGTGKLQNGALGETAFAKDASGRANPFTTTGAGPWSVTANITVTFDGTINEDAVAHEGSHVADRLDLVAAVELLLNFGNGSGDINTLQENVTKYATEFRAYQVSSSVDQINNRTSEVWNRGWREADRTTAINKLLRESKLYKVSPPGTQPGPGPRILEYK
jgi:RHS repeat-associated protein